MTYFDREKDSGASARCGISAPGADIIPKWEYIRTLSADVNKTSKMSLRSILLVGLGAGAPSPLCTTGGKKPNCLKHGMFIYWRLIWIKH